MEFSIIDFCVSLQGEEVTLIVIEGLNMFWKDTQNHLTPHMMMSPKEIFKGEKKLGGIVLR